jgi:hypothetical protein
LNYEDTRLHQIFTDSTKYDFSKIGRFDLIYIDGGHSYEEIYSDTKNAFNVLNNQDSVIVWHDYSKNNEHVVESATLNAIKDAIPQDLHKYIYYVENTMCAIFYRKEINYKVNSDINHNSKPEKFYTVKLETKYLTE